MKTASSRARIVVLGYIVRGPLGGLCWHHAQYLCGLKDAGHEVCFIEDSGDSAYCCYDPIRGVNDRNPDYGLRFAKELFDSIGHPLWAYHDRATGKWYGAEKARIKEFIRSADMVLNLSLANSLDHGLESVPIRIAVDTDPVFTQIRNLADPERRKLTASHNRFFSYGANLPNSFAPDDGFPWQPTRQPVVLRLWPVSAPCANGAFTTVMQWDSYPAREWCGRRFGQKSESFTPFLDFPQRATGRFEIVLGSNHAPREALRARGWTLRSPNDGTLTPWAFQDFVRGSKAEFSVAKHGYVAARCGWFSDRTAAYLASGRPAVVEDTGFSEWLKAKGGVLSFRTPDEAAAQIENINRDYSQHCRMARGLAEEYFEATRVVRALIGETS